MKITMTGQVIHSDIEKQLLSLLDKPEHKGKLIDFYFSYNQFLKTAKEHLRDINAILNVVLNTATDKAKEIGKAFVGLSVNTTISVITDTTAFPVPCASTVTSTVANKATKKLGTYSRRIQTSKTLNELENLGAVNQTLRSSLNSNFIIKQTLMLPLRLLAKLIGIPFTPISNALEFSLVINGLRGITPEKSKKIENVLSVIEDHITFRYLLKERYFINSSEEPIMERSSIWPKVLKNNALIIDDLDFLEVQVKYYMTSIRSNLANPRIYKTHNIIDDMTDGVKTIKNAARELTPLPIHDFHNNFLQKCSDLPLC